MKKLLGFFVGGLCTAFGYLTAVKVVETFSDPSKKARIKRKTNNIIKAFKE